MHESVHDEGRTRHVSGVFQQRNEQVQEHDVRQEDKHAADAAYDTVNDKVLEPSVRHHRSDEGREVRHQPLDPAHRILSQYECTVEYQIQKGDE